MIKIGEVLRSLKIIKNRYCTSPCSALNDLSPNFQILPDQI